MPRIGFFDWTEDRLSLHVFEQRGSRYAHVSSASVTLSGQLTASSIISLAKGSYERIFLSVPQKLLSVRELNFPFSDKDKIKNAIPYELDGLLLGETDNYCMDHLTAGYSGGGSRALAVSIEKTRLKEIVGMFSSVNLEPAAVTSIDIRLSMGDAGIIFKNASFDENVRLKAVIDEVEKPSINLRREELSYTGDVRRLSKSLRMTTALALILLIMLCSETVISFFWEKKENARLSREITALYRECFPEDAKIIDPVRQFRGNLSSLTERKAILTGAPVLDILLQVAESKKNISIYEFNMDEKNIFLKGAAVSFEDVDSFKNTLRPSFSDVKVMDSKTSPDKKINFVITMKVKVI
ncbi:MAG: hypothetical protein HY759_03785 [Nitrospirae bacterium]|nr:hypothetical protein [Nitrospirota bacterium]